MANDLIDLPESHRAVVSEARALVVSVEDVAMEADESSTLNPGIAEALRASAQARPMRVYEGASEVLRLGIAARLTREVA